MKKIKKVVIKLHDGRKAVIKCDHNNNPIYTKDFDGNEEWENHKAITKRNKSKKYYTINNTGLLNRGLWILTSIFTFVFCLITADIMRDAITWQFSIPWMLLVIISIIFGIIGMKEDPELFYGLESYNKNQIRKRRRNK